MKIGHRRIRQSAAASMAGRRAKPDRFAAAAAGTVFAARINRKHLREFDKAAGSPG